MPTVMLNYTQRGSAVSEAEFREIMAESGVVVSDGWFGPTEVPGRGAGPVQIEPALIIVGLRAADLGWHVAQGAALAVGAMSVGWMRNVLNRIRHHPDRALADSNVELMVSVGEYRSIRFLFPHKGWEEAARTLDWVQLPPWPNREFHWNVHWDADRHVWTLDLPSVEPRDP